MSQDYNSTLNLPKTDFPMRAGLPKSEPVTLKAWEDNKVYEKLMEVNEGKPLFVLHDGSSICKRRYSPRPRIKQNLKGLYRSL